MKLARRDAARFLSAPDPKRGALLLYGPDTARIASRKNDVVLSLGGPDAEADMRLTRLSASDVRKDAATLADALRAASFFPGQRVVVLEDATDGLTDAVRAALDDRSDDDAFLVVTGGVLAAKSSLRKFFESHPTVATIAIYADPPTREEVEAACARAGLGPLGDSAARMLLALGQSVDPGDFAQTLEKLALYRHGSTDPLSEADIAACAPPTADAEVDAVLNLIAEARIGEIGPAMRNLADQGVAPVTICIGAERHIRTLHAAVTSRDGAETALSRMRPPVFGPRRDRLLRQARRWRPERLEHALSMLVETDLALRSSSPAPPFAVLERTLIRIAHLAR